MTRLAEVFADGNYRFEMNLRRAAGAEFFKPIVDQGGLIQERNRWLAAGPEMYSALLPGGENALDECIDMAVKWDSLSVDQADRLARIAPPQERCVFLGGLWQPDFVLLIRDEEGSFRLVGGCVCFPSSWSLADKIGQPLHSIHGPVPGLNAQLGRSIDAFLGRISPGTVWQRHNWGLSASPELNQHPSRRLPRLCNTVPVKEVWVRIEEQALVMLPRSGALLFGIRIKMHPLEDVRRDAIARARLCHALETMPEDVAEYKGTAPARSRLLELLREGA